MSNLKLEAAQMLASTRSVTMSSINPEGYPVPVAMVPVKTDGLQTIYLSTITSSNKVKNIQANPKTGISFYKNFNGVTLIGEMEIVTDRTIKAEVFDERWMTKHFPGGVDDPEYTLLKFTAKSGVVAINEEFERIQF